MINAKCKICRRAGTKLFLRGERCLSQKCAIVKKPYPPGPKSKSRAKALSEYGKELKEKQKLKNWYNLEERQLHKYVKEVLKSRRKAVDAETALVKKLESRLDNVIFRLGLAPSRRTARQLISHGHFLVNGRSTNIASHLLKKGDTVKLKESSVKKPVFQKLIPVFKKHKPPVWLKSTPDKLEAQVIGDPDVAEAGLPAELSSIFEFYSQ